MSELPTIGTVEGLLAILRENPARRAVVAEIVDDYTLEVVEYVAEFPGDNPAGPCVNLAIVLNGAEGLLGECEAADSLPPGGATSWASLPLRYGPYCGSWVLPDHPRAPQKPGYEGEE